MHEGVENCLPSRKPSNSSKFFLACVVKNLYTCIMYVDLQVAMNVQSDLSDDLKLEFSSTANKTIIYKV